ncbi:L-allo-threonine aldolase [Hydra vulgaris]|uniref:L-allo-threonine aldolase n=1 Tax=Hydra vulgaris TaxID=6087 RepID=A0ABM4C6I6_HYDVU
MNSNTIFRKAKFILSQLSMRSYYKMTTKSGVVDFRSDTVTQPSPDMRQAMMKAAVGDDVYKEDPTVNELEKFCADLFGMEKALYVPSGTMGNLLCLMAHVNGRGEEIIIGAKQHVYCYEQGGFMQLGSIPARVLPNECNGTISLKDIEENITDKSDFHFCETKLICLENTHLLSGGTPLPLDYLKNVTDLKQKYNLKVHVDGARLYNAAVALNEPVQSLLKNIDSVSMCLSKGLGCPVGSVIGGTEEFIKRAIRLRKCLGGGIRQGGILAAAGLFALKDAREKLKIDHINARLLAEGIYELKLPSVTVDLTKVQTNIVFVKTPNGAAKTIADALSKHLILSSPFSSSILRFVTHLNICQDDVFRCVEVFKQVFKENCLL